MDGISLQPTCLPFVSRTSAEGQIDFNLLLMTGITSIVWASYYCSAIVFMMDASKLGSSLDYFFLF